MDKKDLTTFWLNIIKIDYKNSPKEEENVKSKPLIIFGFIISLTSIFLLLFTINNKFG